MILRKMCNFFSILLVLTTALFAQTELIRNGNFSGGSANWNLGKYGGSSSGSVNSGEYAITVSAAGTEYWNVQFTQGTLSLVQGKTYKFSFDAYKGNQNSGTQIMQVNIGQSGSPYTSYFGTQSKLITLTATKTHYTYTIIMTNASDANARAEFNCGNSTGGYYIDNVSLYEETATTPLLSALPISIDFGSVITGSSKVMNITLQNRGTAATTVSAIQTSSSVFTAGLTVPATVPASGSATLAVTFSPLTAGTVSGTVTIYSDASDNPIITANLTGSASLPGIGISPSSLVFSSAPGVAAKQTISLSNSSSVPITWSLVSNSAWATAAQNSGSIAAASQAVCTVTVNSAVQGVFSGSLTLTHSASNQPSPMSIALSFTVTSGYQPTSPFILNPELGIDFVRNIAAFRSKARDNVNGGYYTNINRQGYSTGANEKALCGQSRISYAFTRAFMLTGDEQYLEMAHHALKFLYTHGWNNGWYFITDSTGNYMDHWGHNDWWSFQQHYALIGISAMVEATGGRMNWNDGMESDHTWLMRGVNSNYAKLWDARPATKGYYNYSNRAWTNKWGKGFTPTVDGVTTHGLLMALMYDSLIHKQRLIELADNIVDHMVGSMAAAAAGFPENYDADWNIDNSSTGMDIGHGYKTAWVLQRAYLRNPDHPEYLAGAQALMQNLYDHGCYDSVNGAPYSYLNWKTGAVTSTNKDFWMTEQGFTSGIMSYYTATTQTQRDMYMRVADGSINFFMDHLIDPVYGEAYNVVSKDGSTVVDANKGGLFTAGYHSSELGYYAYLYSSLYYHKSPVQLYYYYPQENTERTFKLTPIAIEENVLKITAVTLDGAPYTDFNSDTRTLHLAAGVGGKFKVTFGFTAAPTFAISATAGNGGAISPSGSVAVVENSSKTFTITPAAGYTLSDVLVDGVSAGALISYTFSNVTADHTISASFSALPVFTITASAGSGGTISPSGTTSVLQNSSNAFTITPDAGYSVSDVLIDGVSAGAVTSYTFSNVSAAHTISAAFSMISSTVYQINCGSAGAALPYSADQYYSGGTMHAVTNTIDLSGVTDPAPASVYKSERYGNATYTIPGLAAGNNYKIRLHMAELYQTAAGKRKFNVSINGTAALSNFDIYATAGARYKAVVREFTANANSSGNIVIVFTTVTDNATVSGIEIIAAAPNNAPAIATAATASPDTVMSTTTALSVLGSDDNGEANLTYTWAATVTPGATVTFSKNGTNAAKTTVATFTKAGCYTFQVTVKDAGNLTATSSATVTVSQTASGITISPASMTLDTSAKQQFSAAVLDQFANAIPSMPVAWSVSGNGTINTAGLFTAGTAAAAATVSASSGTITGTASVTVQTAGKSVIIYGDELAAAYNNYSWSSICNFLDATPVKVGTKSLAITYSSGWAALFLQKASGTQTHTGFTAYSFWAHGGTGAARQCQFFTRNSAGAESRHVTVSIPANTWTQITIPLSSLGNPSDAGAIMLQESSGSAQAEFNIDQLELK